MCSSFPRWTCLLFLQLLLLLGAPAEARILRVCADPNNLPFSNRRLEGFENELMALVARDMGARVSYTWWAQRRGFLRNTLKAGICDVVPGVPVGLPGVRATHPYYRSTFVFVTRAGLAPVDSLDDPRLRVLKVGYQNGGDDGAATPAALALSSRGIHGQGFSVLGDYREPNPPARIIDAVRSGTIDVAVAWGPLAGFFARSGEPYLALRPLHSVDQPMAFDIAFGVRKGDAALATELDRILARRRGEIGALLSSFGVPLVSEEAGTR
jgi:mxaJ protein